MQKLQLTFNKAYQLRQKIGQTPVASIYLAINMADEDKQISVKLQKTGTGSRLEHQAKIYKIFSEGVGIPRIYWFGRQHDYDVLVTDLLGPSLEHLFRYCGQRFSLKTVCMIADQLLDRLEFIHGKSFVYRDIKPENFLVGLAQRADKLYIIDFELAQKFVDYTGSHVRLQPTKSGTRYGSPLFLSIHGHQRLQQSRRDDLESLGYLLVFFIKGFLPWQDMVAENQDRLNLLIKQKKASIPIQLLCQDLPKQFQTYFNYVKSLEFEEQPDYVWLKRLFKDLMLQYGYKHNLVFDWADKHHDLTKK